MKEKAEELVDKFENLRGWGEGLSPYDCAILHCKLIMESLKWSDMEKFKYYNDLKEAIEKL